MLQALVAALLLSSTLVAPAEAQGWWRMLTGAAKLGKAYTLSDTDMAKMVAQQVAYLDRTNRTLPESSPYTKRLHRVVNGLSEAEGVKLNYKVYQTTQLNAFACPDGSVRVYSALMDALTDAELLGVLGHEIGHVALRHSKRAWQAALVRSAADDALSAMSDTYATLSDSYLGKLSGEALSAKHSRQHETEADDYAYTFLKEKGKNPRVLAIAFRKLKQLSQKGEARYSMLLNAFSSHPDFDSRINRINAQADRDGIAPLK